jgi:hypothetical protein
MADDFEFIRKAIRNFLKGDPEIQILAEAAGKNRPLLTLLRPKSKYINNRIFLTA